MKMKYLLMSLLVGVCCTSCDMSSVKMPSARGRTGEVLVVMTDYHWKGACGDSIRQYLTEPVWGLPASEPMFTLSQNSALGSFSQKTRNVLIINIDAGYEGVKLEYKTDVYAQHQVIFNLSASSADSAVVGIFRYKDVITARFLEKGRDAIIADYKKSIAKPIVEKVREKNQVDIVIPAPYKLDMEKDDFVWISREEGERCWYILMWKEPYVRRGQLETDSLIFKMNAMTRKYVAGPNNSYMADEPMYIPAVKRFEKDGIYCVQINGLWQTEGGGYMGGPYVNHTIVDTQRGQIVTGIGFVFYPNRDKRDMVRQLEAILYTMKPVTEE